MYKREFEIENLVKGVILKRDIDLSGRAIWELKTVAFPELNNKIRNEYWIVDSEKFTWMVVRL